MHAPITEAIIVAGGLGTRLQSAVPDLPKCMAPVAGHPFIYYVLRHLQQQGITRFIFSLGYKADLIEPYISLVYPKMEAVFITEPSPLGTGGAIQLAGRSAKSDTLLIVNGDTLFTINLQSLTAFHYQQSALCTLALKSVTNTNRYGAVRLDDNGRIIHFAEKQALSQALINGGAYLLDMPQFLQENLQAPFSFETDYLEKKCPSGQLFGQEQDGYFIDIGVPEDYERACRELIG